MYPASTQFMDALRRSHVVTLQVDAYRGATLLQADLPISGGSVSVDGGSQIRRTLSVTVADPDLDPKVDPQAVLAPFGSDLVVKRGIRYPNGTTEWVPLGRFRIEDVQATIAQNGISVTGSDRAATVKDLRFTAITQANTSNTVVQEITRLIQEALPGVGVTDYTGATAATPSVYWERERWEAIEQLGQAIGADVYFDPAGNGIIAPAPTVTNTPAWWVDAGELGVMVDGSRETSRETVYNGVVASGESDGDIPPVTATVWDSNPASPTYYLGTFGKKPFFYVSPLLTTTAQCVSAATSMLGRVTGLVRQLDLSCVPNPALESGDVIRVRFPDGSTETHLVDSFTVPLDPGTAMSLKTRSPEPATE
ncbi:DUF5047 domain-containing protein [Kribbella sp. WER1]